MKESIFKNKNFTLAFLGALVSNVGAIFYSFAVSFFILEITNNNSIIQGTYLSVCGITFILTSLFGGVLADRLNKGKVMAVCDFIRGSFILLATLSIFFFKEDNSMQVIILFIMGIIGNIIGGIFSPSSSSLLPLIVKKDQLQEANSYYSILNSFQSIVGIVLAGILYSTLSIYVLFSIVGVCYIGSGISELFIKYEYKKKEDTLTLNSALKDIGSGFKYMFDNKSILSIILCIIFLNFFFAPIFDNAFPYIVKTDLNNNSYLFDEYITPEMWSSIFSLFFAFGSLIGGIIINKIKIKKSSRVSKISLLINIFITLLISLSYFICIEKGLSISAFLLIVSGLLLIIGISLIFINIPMTTALQKTIDLSIYGKVSAALDMGSQGLIPIATFLAGLIISQIGVSSLLFICTAGLLIVGLLYFFNKKANLD